MMSFDNNEKDFQKKLQKETEIPVIVQERVNQAYRLIENNTAVQKKAPKEPYHWMKNCRRYGSSTCSRIYILRGESCYGQKFSSGWRTL